MTKKKGTIKAISRIRDIDEGKQVGFMLQEEEGVWKNIDGTEEELKKLKKHILQKGNRISFDYDNGEISNLTLLDKSNKSNNSYETNSKSSHDEDDFVKFPELLDKAHDKFGDNLNIETGILLDADGNPMIDFEKKTAIARAEVIIRDGDKVRRFSGHGDATPKNTTKTTEDSFIRMAETRAIVRALRFATNDARTAKEEVKEGQK